MRKRLNLSNQMKRKKTMPTELIGILGITSGSGAYHLAISLGNFLQSKERYRVGIVELREEGKLKRMMDGDVFVSDGCVGFRRQDVDYYPEARWEDVCDLRGRSYDYLLLLYPPSDSNQTYPMDCHRKIAVGSLKPWHYRDYQVFLRNLFVEKQSILSWDLYGLFLNKKEKHQFDKEFSTDIKEVPWIEDPFHLQRRDVEFLQSILA